MSIYENPQTFGGLPIRRVAIIHGEFMVCPDGARAWDSAASQRLDTLDLTEPAAYDIRLMRPFPSSTGCCLAQAAALSAGVAWYCLHRQFWISILIGLGVDLVLSALATMLGNRQTARRLAQYERELRGSAPVDAKAEPLWQRGPLAVTLARCAATELRNAPALMLANDPIDVDFAEFAETLAMALPRFPRVESLGINLFTQDELEISWIQSGDCGPFLAATPQLKRLQVRGAQVRLGHVPPGIRELIVESGGLGHELLMDLADAALPELERLELWIGQEDFGCSCEPHHVVELLTFNPLPRLKHLAIRNCEFADAVIRWLMDSPLLQRLETLDLSLGCVSDEGAELLLGCERASALQKLDLHYHYISDPWQRRLQERLGNAIELDLSDPMEPEDFDEDGAPLRYSATGE